ncbi:MAG: SAF domain-containing protein [Pseudomonadota bacterium]
MNLSRMLSARAADGNSVRVGLIGAGRFGTMVLSQLRFTPGIQVAAVADIDAERAHTALAIAQWPPLKAVARSLADAVDSESTWVTAEPEAVASSPLLDVVIEATGDVPAALRHAVAAIGAGTSVVMATLAADVLAGPLLAARAAAQGVVYSYASGDRPSEVCALVDEAQAAGFEIVAAGMGCRHLPAFTAATPDTAWDLAGIDAAQARARGLNPRTTTAALDGTKAALTMAAVANATGLEVADAGLSFHPCGAHDLARLFRPRADGGMLERAGLVDTASSLERDGREVIGGLPQGAWVTVRPHGHFACGCLREAGLVTDPSGTYAALWRPWRLGGLGVGRAIAEVTLRREPAGSPRAFAADVVAVAKRDLAPGEVLDAVGGACLRGAVMAAPRSLDMGALPIGLADAPVRRAVPAGTVLTWDDVELDESSAALALRRSMEDEISFE